MQEKHSKYLKSFFFTFTFLLLGVLFFTLGVDPYASFHTIAIPKVNAVKTGVHENIRLYKANRVLQEKPSCILLGSSRVMAGLDPDDVEAITNQSCYNCGIAAATFEEIYHYFLHALHAQPDLKTVILGLDFFCFNAFEKSKEDLPKFLHGMSSPFVERLPALFSYSALKAGVKTFKNNAFHKPQHTFFRKGLFNPEIAGSLELNPIAPKELEYVQAIHNAGMYHQFKICESSIDKYALLVTTCKEKNIKLKVFINPAQAIYWEAMFQHGFWGEMEYLKEKLAAIYPFWDFSGFNAVTVQQRKCTENLLYYECSHFRPLLGKVILDILYDKNSSPIQFGYFLQPETIQENFIAMRKEREIWARTHPETIALLKRNDETHLVIK